MSELDNLEDDRGYDEEVTFNDIFLSCWVCVWFMLILTVYYLLVKHPIKSYTWKLGAIVSSSFVVRTICQVISFISWCITLDYGVYSVTFIVDVIDLAVFAINGPFLYLFFIYRLFVVYNLSSIDAQTSFGIKTWYYIFMLVLCFALFVSGSVLVYSYCVFDVEVYNIMHILSLCIEITLYGIIMRLFSKPLLQLAVTVQAELEHGQSYDSDNPETVKKNDKLLWLATKLNILTTLSLVTSIFVRVVEIVSYTYCPDECDLTYFSYSLWTMDGFCNIFCILCSFRTGDIYYEKFCRLLHDCVLKNCVQKKIAKKVKEKQNRTITSTTNPNSPPTKTKLEMVTTTSTTTSTTTVPVKPVA